MRNPVIATRNDHSKIIRPWYESCNPSTDSASEASNIDITKHEIIAPATRNASFRSLFKSLPPANIFAIVTNSCACHAFWNVSKSLRLPREKHFEPQKVVRDPSILMILTSKSLSRAGVVQTSWRLQLPKVVRTCQFLMILTSKSFSRAGVVQILVTSTSKSAPTLLIFNDFDFQTAVSRRRGANFGVFNIQKCSDVGNF